MWFDTRVAFEIANEIAKEIARDRMEYNEGNAQREAQQMGYVQHPRRSFNFVAAFTRLFQRRKNVQTPAPETQTQRRTA